MAERTLTEIGRLAQELFKALGADSTEGQKAFRIWKLSTDSDARETRDDPTVRAAKRGTKKR